MTRWFLRLLALICLSVAGWSSLSTPIMKTSPIYVFSAHVADVEAISALGKAQTILLKNGISKADELYQSERAAFGKMLRMSNFGLIAVAILLVIASLLPFTKSAK